MVNFKNKEYFDCVTGKDTDPEMYGINSSVFKKVDNVDMVFDSRGQYLGIRTCIGSFVTGKYICKKGTRYFKSIDDLNIWNGKTCANFDLK